MVDYRVPRFGLVLDCHWRRVVGAGLDPPLARGRLMPPQVYPNGNHKGESQASPFLQIRDLQVGFPKSSGILKVIDRANLTLGANQAVGIVGESGSGKTMLCRSLLGTLDRHGATIVSGRVLYDGADLARAPERVWRRIRGREIGYVPQSSLAGLNPVLTIRTQLVESITTVRPMSGAEADREA